MNKELILKLKNLLGEGKLEEVVKLAKGLKNISPEMADSTVTVMLAGVNESVQTRELPDGTTIKYHIANVRATNEGRILSVLTRLAEGDEDLIASVTDVRGEINPRYIVSRMMLTANITIENQFENGFTSGDMVKTNVSTSQDENGITYVNLRTIRPVSLAKTKTVAESGILSMLTAAEEKPVVTKITLDELQKLEGPEQVAKTKEYLEQEGLKLSEVGAAAKAADMKLIPYLISLQKPEEVTVEEGEEDLF